MLIFLGNDYEIWVKKHRSACNMLHMGFTFIGFNLLIIEQVGLELGTMNLAHPSTNKPSAAKCGRLQVHPQLLFALVNPLQWNLQTRGLSLDCLVILAYYLLRWNLSSVLCRLSALILERTSIEKYEANK